MKASWLSLLAVASCGAPAVIGVGPLGDRGAAVQQHRTLSEGTDNVGSAPRASR